MTPAQARAARALLDWTQAELAQASGVGLSTIKEYEAARGKRALMRQNLDAIRRALEAAGVEFLEGEGVRRRDASDLT